MRAMPSGPSQTCGWRRNFSSFVRRGAARGVGLAIAALVAVGFAAVIGLYMSQAPAPRAPVDPANPDFSPPDIRDFPAGGNTASNQLMGSRGLFVQLMDRKDPTRLAGELQSESVDQIENRRYHVGQPRIWIYLKDGRVLLVQADEGRLYMPDRSREPEAGTLEGNTVIRLYPPPAPGTRVDPEAQPPLLTARMNQLTFDNSIGEATTPDLVMVTSPRVDFQGRSLRLVFNEPKQRIESLEVKTEGRLVIREDKPVGPFAPLAEAAGTNEQATQVDADSAAVVPSDASATPDAPRTTPPAAAPVHAAGVRTVVPEGGVETFYHAIFADDVDVVWKQARLRADLLNVFARTVDGSLVPGAVASTAHRSEPRGRLNALAMPRTPWLAPMTAFWAATAMQPDDSVSRSGESTDVVMTWTGPLTLKPVETMPEELTVDEVFARFESPNASRVTFEDRDSGLGGDAGTISYAATTRNLFLRSPEQKPGVLALGSDGTLTGSDIRFNLGNGVGRVQGPGKLVGAPQGSSRSESARATLDDLKSAAPATQRASWSHSADFTFRVADAQTTSELQSALLSGDVLLADDRSSMKAGLVRSEFVAVANSRGQTAPVLSRLVASEGVEASDGRDGTLTAQHLDVSFEPADDQRTPRPTRMLAAGNVRTHRGTSTLTARTLDATFSPDPEQPRKALVHIVNARDAVRYDGDDGVFATAEHLEADAIAQNATLLGDQVVVGKGQTSITSTQVRLDQPSRSMEVFGAGNLSHVQDGYIAPITASWTKGMIFDDVSGVVRCWGDTRAQARPDDMTTETLVAERLRIELTPGGVESIADATTRRPDDAQGTDMERGERRLIRATATGSVSEIPGGQPALAESISYAAGQAHSKESIERARSLKAATITLEAEDQKLLVPTPGRLYLQDTRPEDEEAASPAAAQGPETGTRGYALFEWDGTMELDRRSGAANMTDRVRVTHRAPKDPHALYLECDRLNAEGTGPKNDSSVDGSADAGEVRSVIASGNVYAKAGERELAADRAQYFARERTLVASGENGNIITLFDPKTATPVTARELAWELDTGRIEIRQPSPIVTPR